MLLGSLFRKASFLHSVRNSLCSKSSVILLPVSTFNNSRVETASKRCFCALPGPQESTPNQSFPQLMNFPQIIWPSTLLFIKNWIMITFVIRPQMDPEFNISDFVAGAKQAVQVISSKLANGNFEKLNQLVSNDVLRDVVPVVEKLSLSQRRQLEVKSSDMFFSFPYQVGIIFDEEDKDKKRWVEITMVFHVLYGLTDIMERGESLPLDMRAHPEYADKVFICNYRFIKEFTKGKHSDWTVNILNHFRLTDLAKKRSGQ